MKKNNFFNKMKKSIKSFFVKIKNKDTSFFIFALCICLLATAVIWRFTSGSPDENMDITKQSENAPDGENKEGLEVNKDPYLDITEKAIDDYTKESEELKKKQEEDKKQQENMLDSLAKPMSGEIAMGFSDSELEYYDSVGEWRTHTAIDIVPDSTLQVCAAYAGKIEKVESSDLMGTEIVIDHGNNLKTIYKCLNVAKVDVGDIVQKGQNIGTIGLNDNIETLNQAHLHFEIAINDELVNPTDYLNFQ